MRRDEAAEQRSLHGELEVVQTEHAQKLGEVQEEQRKLKCRLEQLRQQGCRCREQQGAEQQQESHYATQVGHAYTSHSLLSGGKYKNIVVHLIAHDTYH